VSIDLSEYVQDLYIQTSGFYKLMLNK